MGKNNETREKRPKVLDPSIVGRISDLDGMTDDAILESLYLSFISEERKKILREQGIGTVIRRYYGYPAVVCLLIDRGEEGYTSTCPNYTEELASLLGFTVDGLFEAARKNSMVIFPSKLAKISEILDEAGESVLANGVRSRPEGDLNLITSDDGTLATAILYDGVVRNVSDSLGGNDLWLLPSSVYGWIAVPAEEFLFDDKQAAWEWLVDMVTEINQMEVALMDRLGNYPLYYDRKADKILTSEELGVG